MAQCDFKVKKKNKDNSRLSFFQSDFTLPEPDESFSFFMGETVNKALLDTGASSTVCGAKWLKVFEESLSPEESSELQEIKCNKSFRFGDGDCVVSTIKKKLPITLYGQKISLEKYIIDNNILLLLSRDTMKKIGKKIDNEKDKNLCF